ncbi:hypothetical protein HY624_03060 [Candidatus Uhrbacteria bacterium]|nr:hypothetical protein [Candidatus Uhrbacteria bacterium]
MSNTTQSAGLDAQVVAQWQTIISTQMHFNEMILQTRAIGSSVVLAAYGAAAVTLGQYPNEYVTIFDQLIHISGGIICFALTLLFSIFLMDVTYYYRLLLGVVQIGSNFEKNNPSLVATTTLLGERVSLWSANFVVIIFYVIPFSVGGLSLWYVLTHYPPTVHT